MTAHGLISTRRIGRSRIALIALAAVGALTLGAHGQEMCPPNSLFSQNPSTPDGGWTASVSDTAEALCWFDNYAVDEDIYGATWWGLMSYFHPIYGWQECLEDPTQFQIIFWADNGGQPGAMWTARNVSLSPEDTGLLYGYPGWTLYRFHAEWEYPVSLHSGWVSIEGALWLTPDCWFMWMDSPEGDDYCWFEEDGQGQAMDRDYSICLLPQPIPEDVNGDGVVDVLDLLAVIAAWGNPGGPEDVNGDGIIDVLDLLAVIAAWS